MWTTVSPWLVYWSLVMQALLALTTVIICLTALLSNVLVSGATQGETPTLFRASWILVAPTSKASKRKTLPPPPLLHPR